LCLAIYLKILFDFFSKEHEFDERVLYQVSCGLLDIPSCLRHDRLDLQ